MEGTQENRNGISQKNPRLPPRCAALLIAFIAGVPAGAMGFVIHAATRYWPEPWGGGASGMLVVAVLFPPMILLQKNLLKPLFRWTGLRLVTILENLRPESFRDAGFGLLLFCCGIFSIMVTEAALMSLLPGGLGEHRGGIFPLAVVWFMGLVVVTGFIASAEVFMDQEPEDAKIDGPAGQTGAGLTRLYFAGVANLCLGAPLLVWVTLRLLVAPLEPVVGMLMGATLGTAIGIGDGTKAGLPSWRPLAVGLILADLAAAAVGLPAAWAITEYGFAESEWLPALLSAFSFIGMTVLTGFSADWVIRKIAGGGEALGEVGQ